MVFNFVVFYELFEEVVSDYFGIVLVVVWMFVIDNENFYFNGYFLLLKLVIVIG